MNKYKKSAIAIGVLFLVALFFNPIATEITNPILKGPDYLTRAYPGRNILQIATLLNFICAVAMIFIPIILYGVVGKNFRNLATAYIVFRALEGILFFYIGIKTLLFIQLSEEYINAQPALFGVFNTLGQSIRDEIQWATNVYIFIFAIGAAVFYYLLYRSNVVPKFLSIWGILAVIILFAGAIMAFFGLSIFDHVPLMEGMVYFAPPIAVNELVLGIWLIAKGFNQPSR